MDHLSALIAWADSLAAAMAAGDVDPRELDAILEKIDEIASHLEVGG